MQTRTIVWLIALLVGGAGCAGFLDRGSDEPLPYDLAEVRAGAATYHAYCASCHGVEAKGNGPVAGVIRIPPPDLTRIAARRGGVFNEAHVESIIDGRTHIRAHGPGEMPIWGDRLIDRAGDTGRESQERGRLHALVAYLESIQEPPVR